MEPKKLAKTATQITIILLAIQTLIIVSVWRLLPPEIPLFYSRPWGQDQLVEYPGIVTLPAICLIILVTNLIMSRLAEKEEVLIKQMLASASMAFTFLILISLVQNVRLII